MKLIFTTTWMLFSLIGINALAAEPTPSPTPNEAESSATRFFYRTEYSHSMGDTHYSRDDARGITFGAGAISNFAINFGTRDDSNAFYLGIGYNWLGKLQQNGVDMDQSANKVFLQAGYDRIFFDLGPVSPRIGFSLQYLPQILSSMPDETTEPTAIRFDGGLGLKAYVGTTLPFDYFIHLGYQVMWLSYKDGPGATPQTVPDFGLAYRSVYISFGAGF
jgi:hypothetical protein